MVPTDTKKTIAELFDHLRHELIAPSRVVIAWRQEEGDVLYASGNKAIERISEEELRLREPLFPDIFKTRPDAHVIIRSQPSYVEAVSSIRNLRSFRPPLDDAAQIIGTRIVLARHHQPTRIVNALRRGNACVVKDGVFALSVGASPERAIASTLVLEKSCLALVEGSLIGGVKSVNPLVAQLYYVIYRKFYGGHDEAIKSQTKEELGREISEMEMEKREAVIATGRQLVEENLVQGTWGNVSQRLDDRYMLVTPSGLSYHRLTPYDIVRFDMDTHDYEGRIKPSSESRMHAAIYRRDPEIHSIIHSHAIFGSVFAACHQAIPVIHEEDRVLLGDRTGYAKGKLAGTMALVKSVLKGLSGNAGKTCIIGGHGLVAAGASPDEALMKCRAMERAARRYLGMKASELRG